MEAKIRQLRTAWVEKEDMNTAPRPQNYLLAGRCKQVILIATMLDHMVQFKC